MSTRMYEVQQKVFTLLSTDGELKKMVEGVFDYVPENTVCPYVTFGHILSSPSSTKIEDGEEITLTLDIWSESRGRQEAVRILTKIEQILGADIELDTAFLIDQKVTNRDVDEESYGLYHATLEIKFNLEWRAFNE